MQAMAKSEIPSIVVHPGIGGCCSGSVSDGAMSERPRLAKQEEIDMEEENFVAASPITIHIQGERDGFSDRLDEDSSPQDVDRMGLPPSASSVESSGGGGSDSDNKSVEKSGPRSHGHGKGNGKQQLGKQGSSQGSLDGSSPSLSRDSSTETYTDSTGIDLQQFIVDTLHKSQKDRAMLLKIEQDLYTLVKDNKCQVFKFTPMSSYNRMLVHRVAAFFGMEHNIDKPGTSVIVNKTKNTRLPDVRFSEYIRDELVPEEPKKLILKRDSASFEEGKESPERQSSMDSRRSKSFEEREEEYEKARARIFNQDEGYGESPYSLRSQDGTLNSSRRSSQEDLRAWTGEPRPWSSTDSDSSSRKANSFEMENGPVAGNSVASGRSAEGNDQSSKASSNGGLLHPGGGLPPGENRPSLTKASSFGGITLLTRDSSAGSGAKGGQPHQARLTKAESLNETSSSGVSQPGSLHRQVPSADVLQLPPPQTIPSQEREALPPGVSSLSPNPHNRPPSQDGVPVGYTLENTGHAPLTDNSSQACQWEGAVKENGLPVAPVGEASPGVATPLNPGAALWPLASVDSIPAGSVLLNPASLSTSPYYSTPETMVYQAKGLSPTQAYVVTPIHALKGPLLPPPTSATPNGKPLVAGVQGNHSQQPSSFPGSQYGAVVYIPCLASHLAPGTLMGQQGAAPQPPLQLITAQQPQQQQQQQQAEHRPNQGVMPDLVPQLSALTLTPPPVPPPAPSAAGEMATYLVHAPSGDLLAKMPPAPPPSSLKGQPAPLTTQLPLYYVPQSQTSVFNGVRYVCPSGPPMILHSQNANLPGSNHATCCIKGSEGTPGPTENSNAQSASSHLVGHHQPVYPGYTFVGFPHHNLDSGQLHQVPTTVAPAALPYFQSTPANTTNPQAPVYQYSHNNMVLNGAIPISSQQPQQQQQQQPFFSQHSQVCMVGNNGATYTQAAYRPVSPNMLQSAASGTAPYLSYAIYSPQNGNYNSLPSSFLHVLRPNMPTVVGGLRNPAPLHGSVNVQLQQQQQHGFQSLPVHFTTASTTPNHSLSNVTSVPQPQLSRGKVLFPVKQDLNVKDALNSMGAEMKFNSGTPRLHLPMGACMPPSTPIYRQTLPLLPDVRLLGRPLHQVPQLNPALLLAQQQQQQQQQRFSSSSHLHHPHHHPPHQYTLGPPGYGRGGTTGTTRGMGRKGKIRTPTHKGSAPSPPSHDGNYSPLELLNRGSPLILEVEGTPQGLRRNELERYLEPLVVSYGAKIQVWPGDPSETLLNPPCKHRVLAVFETEAAAQSALVNIKTAKFQLRPSSHCKHAKS